MTNVVIISDHSTRALSRLTEQFKGKENIQALVEMFMEELNELEVTGFQLLLQRSVADAEGAQLDIIGEHVGLPRGGRTDTEYRIAVYGKIAQNSSDGSAPTVYQLVKTLTGSSTVRIIDQYPAAVKIIIDAALTDISQREAIQSALGAGIALDAVQVIPTPSTFFTLGSSDGGGLSPATGLGLSTSDAIPSPTGGELAFS